MSTALQGSVQGLVLLNIFISDLGNGIWSRLIASADNTKLRGAASALREQKIQNLNKLKEQSGKNRLMFEKDKSKAECIRTIEMCVRKWLCRQHF